MFKKDKNIFSGFTLIELLVVVVLIGIISSIGIVAYNGYVSSSKQKAAENTLNALSIAQLEYKSNKGTFYQSSSPTSANSTTTSEINLNLFGVTAFSVSGSQSNDKLTGQDYFYSSSATATTFILRAQEKTGVCVITLDQTGLLNKTNC
jgi:prepilin-type N-terminal cleavage/methylation domain-containing protein